MENKYKWLIFGVCALIFFLVMLSADQKPKVNITEDYILTQCSNKSLENTINCVNDFKKEIYKYKITPDDINLTFEQLTTVGGDCKNWGEWESNLYKKIGFNSNTLTFPLEDWKVYKENTTGHMIVEVNDKFTICYVDTIKVLGCGQRVQNGKI